MTVGVTVLLGELVVVKVKNVGEKANVGENWFVGVFEGVKVRLGTVPTGRVPVAVPVTGIIVVVGENEFSVTIGDGAISLLPSSGIW